MTCSLPFSKVDFSDSVIASLILVENVFLPASDILQFSMGFMVYVEKQDSKNLPLLEKLTLFILFFERGQRLPFLEDIHCQPRAIYL